MLNKISLFLIQVSVTAKMISRVAAMMAVAEGIRLIESNDSRTSVAHNDATWGIKLKDKKLTYDKNCGLDFQPLE